LLRSALVLALFSAGIAPIFLDGGSPTGVRWGSGLRRSYWSASENRQSDWYTQWRCADRAGRAFGI